MEITRRALTAGLVAAPALLRGVPALATLPPLPPIDPRDVTFVRPGDALYDQYLPAYNLRTELRPSLRAMCCTAKGVAQTIAWLRDEHIPFALRSGGHCFEGFSQSISVVVDTRLMNDVHVDGMTLAVGAGVSLGAVYQAISPQGMAFPGGSCPTVGVSGHTLGGGFGLLARSRGLACDVLQAIELIDANGKTVVASAAQNADLFWASRGGGGGAFGAAMRFHFAIAPIGKVTTFGVTWNLPEKQAVALFAAWEAWAPDAPRDITALLRLSKRKDGLIDLHCFGQSEGPARTLRRELKTLLDIARPQTAPDIRTVSVMAAINHFAGSWDYVSQYSKGKSDFITAPLPAAGIEALIGGIAALPPGEVLAICDAHGGAVHDTAPDATAFAYRAGTRFCIQYYTGWTKPMSGVARMQDLRTLYAAMRPWSGGAYVNYCDTDISDWRKAYWRQNLPRLRTIKAKVDPGNVFRHAQSVV
jgi:FAD/FMN-containing dehydrogenase